MSILLEKQEGMYAWRRFGHEEYDGMTRDVGIAMELRMFLKNVVRDMFVQDIGRK
jgi:hypothetical protein